MSMKWQMKQETPQLLEGHFQPNKSPTLTRNSSFNEKVTISYVEFEIDFRSFAKARGVGLSIPLNYNVTDSPYSVLPKALLL